MVFAKYSKVEFLFMHSLNDTKRKAGGFGSTGER
jgi:dUTPase